MTQIDWEVLAGMNADIAEWVEEWRRENSLTVAGMWRMWGMGSDEDEDDRHSKTLSESKVHCLELDALSHTSCTPITTLIRVVLVHT